MLWLCHKVYKAHFEPYFGFTFNRGGLKNDPNWCPSNSKHSLWKSIDSWYNRFRAQAKRDEKAFEIELLKDKEVK